MTDSAMYKRSPTTPSTPSLRNGSQNKKMKREENLSPTRRSRNKDITVEDMTRQHLIESKELQRLQGLVKFLELERKFKVRRRDV
ncbi:LANO_0D09890g1_1 [Lachancea nothofagi CBS 11611]|uniref:LANO_0D09890g1_1 n=1 Tax=Lachancea nothofagi CBS 11611 TaxID=1266666 RepID=A0A1G4JJV5_9SACH|nr:LANO_0D09890g1_1 [Lachancea nothofagi CBS 11611]